MEHVVRLVAPSNLADFVLKLMLFLLLAGALNHFRDVMINGSLFANPYWANLRDATWTALPMCTLALSLIKHLNALQKRLHKQATTDPLTNIPNRRWFFDACGPRVAADKTLVVLDVDHFKQVNDTYGHDVGDLGLQAIVTFIMQTVPSDALCARLGGEEFGILFPKADKAVFDCVTEICMGTDLDLPITDTLRLTLSAGVFAATRDAGIQVAFSLADAALYEAKNAGRAQYAMAKLGPAHAEHPLPDALRAVSA